MDKVKPMEKPGLTIDDPELKRQIDRDHAIIGLFGGTPPEEITPELKAEIEPHLPKHLQEKKEE